MRFSLSTIPVLFFAPYFLCCSFLFFSLSVQKRKIQRPEGGRARGVAVMNNAKHTLESGQGVARGQTLSLNIQELLLCFVSARKMKSLRLPRFRT